MQASVGRLVDELLATGLNLVKKEKIAQVVELVDTQDLKSCSHCDCAGSIPAPGTETFGNSGGFFVDYVLHLYFILF